MTTTDMHTTDTATDSAGDTGSVAPLAAYAARFAAEHEFDGGTAELLGDLAGRFSFVCEAATEDYLPPDVLGGDLRFLEHFLAGARQELRRQWGWSL